MYRSIIDLNAQFNFFFFVKLFFSHFNNFHFLTNKKFCNDSIQEINQKILWNFKKEFDLNILNKNLNIFYFTIINSFFEKIFEQKSDLFLLWEFFIIFQRKNYLKQYLISCCLTIFYLKKNMINQSNTLQDINLIFTKKFTKSDNFIKYSLLFFKETYGISSFALI